MFQSAAAFKKYALMLAVFLPLAVFVFLRPAAAQDAAWVQIEAQPSLATAEERARSYAATLPAVNGFSLGGGWYAVALGPYSPDDAQDILASLRRDGLIPRDSFIAFAASFQQQFWPIGANLLNVTPLAPALEQTAEPAIEPAPEPQIAASDETPREARASEGRLNRDERKDLQTLLQWAGFYQGRIDGAFGRGTRGSMAAWQEANGYEPTGILTTLQRTALLQAYNAILDGLGMQVMTDADAGISMMVPTEVVAFDRYESPFAHYEPTGSIPEAKLLLISQEGDQNTLFGLYDIMQTLEIVPLDGERTRGSNSFSLIGTNDSFLSQSEVSLKNGRVKGFTLIWPTGDEERRRRIISEMQNSFAVTEAVLDPTAGMDQEQQIDLVSGLAIRTPRLSRSGFYVAPNGTVLTSADAVESCQRITVDGDFDASVVSVDAGTGLALLRPVEALSPVSIAAFQSQLPRLHADIAVAGYPFEGALNAPTLTFGKLSDTRGLGGEQNLFRIDSDTLSGDVGGPIMDSTGAVIGILAPLDLQGRALPKGVGFGVRSSAMGAILNDAGISPIQTLSRNSIAAEDLSLVAADMTVLVSCWD
jgi:S1-C subfamily serine protease/peptidoglycan hydrolase-like protein with peptidoglycan-binding domain